MVSKLHIKSRESKPRHTSVGVSIRLFNITQKISIQNFLALKMMIKWMISLTNLLIKLLSELKKLFNPMKLSMCSRMTLKCSLTKEPLRVARLTV